MRVLIIKMSSMGDVLHTLPALTDATHAIPNIQFDWLVEPAFADIPSWHQAVSRVIPTPLRQWRKKPFQTLHNKSISTLKKTLNEKQYDCVIDAQGLLKSAWLTKLIKASSHGLDKRSARESLSHYFYTHQHTVPKNLHAVARIRALFSKALQYKMPNTAPDFSINTDSLSPLSIEVMDNYVVFIHGTTWRTKQYPEHYWKQLIKKTTDTGMTVYLPWGNDTEKNRSEKLAKDNPKAIVLPKLSITGMARLLNHATAVVSVDTGLGHLSAALGKPTISLYGATNPDRVGALGKESIHLKAQTNCSPCSNKKCPLNKQKNGGFQCYLTLPPTKIFQVLQKII